MLNLQEYWRKKTGLKDIPPEVQKEWEERVVPILENPSRKREATIEAEEIVNSFFLRGSFHRMGKLGSKLDNLAEKLESQLVSVAEREKVALEEIREAVDRIEGRLEQPVNKVEKSVNDADMRVIKEQNTAILKAIGWMTEKYQEEAGILNRMRKNWKFLVVCGLAVLFLMVSSAWVGWQIGASHVPVWD